MGELKELGKAEKPKKVEYEDKYHLLPQEKWTCGNCGRVGRSPWHSCRDVRDRKWVYLR